MRQVEALHALGVAQHIIHDLVEAYMADVEDMPHLRVLLLTKARMAEWELAELLAVEGMPVSSEQHSGTPQKNG